MTEMAKIFSFCGGQGGHDVQLGDGTGSGDGGATKSGEVVAIGAGDAFEQSQRAQPFEAAGERGRVQGGHDDGEVCASQAADVELGPLEPRSSACSVCSKKFNPLT